MVILYGLYFVLPALVLVHLIFGARATRWHLVGGLGLSILAVGWGGYIIAIPTFGGYRHHTLLLLNALAVWLGRRKGFRPREMLHRLVARWRPSIESWLVAVLLAAVGAAGLLLFDTHAFSNSCLHRALSVAVGLPLGNMDQILPDNFLKDWLLMADFGEREGAYAIPAPFAYLFGFFGLRLFYAAGLVLCGAFGYLSARRVVPGSPTARLLVAALFAAFPLCADILWNDVNTVALLASSALLWLAVEEGVSAAWLGVFLGILLAVRHEALPCAFGPLLLSARRGLLGRRAWVAYFGAALATLVPVLLHHVVSAGSPIALETFAEYSKLPHKFLGVPFAFHGMLNFPFYAHVVRTPFNPLPLFLLWPAWLVARLGLIVSALIVTGAIAVVRPSRALGGAAAWVMPYALLLGINENWLQVEKMGAVTPIMPPVLLLAGCGLATILRPPVRVFRLVGLACCVGALYAGLAAALHVAVPYDPRFYREYPWFLPEDPAYLDVERSLLRAAPWPKPEWASIPPVIDRARDLAHSLRAWPYEDRSPSARELLMQQIVPGVYENFLRQRDMHPPPAAEAVAGEPSIVEIDLSRPWVVGPGWVHRRAERPTAGELSIDLYHEAAPQTYARFPLPWSPGYVVTLTAFRYYDDVFLALSGPNRYERPVDLKNVRPPPYEPIIHEERPAPPGMKLVLLLPPSANLHVIDLVSFDPSRAYRWHVAPGDPLRITGPVHWRHD